MRRHINEDREDDEDPLPPCHAPPACVPEEHVKQGRPRQEDETEDRQYERGERAVNPGSEDPHERQRQTGRQERDQDEDAAQRCSLLSSRCGRAATFSHSKSSDKDGGPETPTKLVGWVASRTPSVIDTMTFLALSKRVTVPGGAGTGHEVDQAG